MSKSKAKAAPTRESLGVYFAGMNRNRVIPGFLERLKSKPKPQQSPPVECHVVEEAKLSAGRTKVRFSDGTEVTFSNRGTVIVNESHGGKLRSVTFSEFCRLHGKTFASHVLNGHLKALLK